MTDSANNKGAPRVSRATRDDVARYANVSAAVVSYVVNNGPRPVSPETRRRVEEAIEALGYYPNTIARTLRADQSHTVGLILPNLTDPQYAELASSFQHACRAAHYLAVVCASGGDVEGELQAIGMLRNHQADGVAILPTQDSPALLRPLHDAGMPLVVLERHLPNAHSITVDDLRGGYLGAEHLLALGHRRIGLILHDVERTTGSERLLGYTQALADRRIGYDERLVVRSTGTADAAHDAMGALLRLRRPPTALLADSHTIALGAMRAIYAGGLRIPDDISIVGFGASSLAAHLPPPLTTIECAPYTLGEMAAELVLRLAAQHESASASAPILPVALVERASTAPPPACDRSQAR